MAAKIVLIVDQMRCIEYEVVRGAIVVKGEARATNLSGKRVLYAKALDDIKPGLYAALLKFLKDKAADHLKNGGHAPEFD